MEVSKYKINIEDQFVRREVKAFIERLINDGRPMDYVHIDGDCVSVVPVKEEEIIGFHVDELVDFVHEKLGISSIDKSLIGLIFELEDDFLVEKGIAVRKEADDMDHDEIITFQDKDSEI